MLLSIILILVVGVVAYFYYVQGMFTGLLSAISGAIAAAISVGYHESLNSTLFISKLPNAGIAFSLILLFSITFVAVRLILDAAVPGNVRLPAIMDKIGGAAMGFILGMFGAGILAIAAQSMSFGPGILWYTRFTTSAARDVQVPGHNQAMDTKVSDELKSETLTDADRQSLLLPFDEWTLGFVSHLSENGATQGAVPFSSIHPNYLDELFGQRIGIEAGVDHTVYNAPGHEPITVPLVYTADKLPQNDAEPKFIRTPPLTALSKPTLASDEGHIILIVRAMMSVNAADTDHYVRFSTGAVRLVAKGVNYMPIGTMDEDGVLRLNKPDDFLFVNVSDKDHGADFVFYVPRSVSAGIVQAGAAPSNPKSKAAPSAAVISDGVFFEFKRFARIDLSGKAVEENRAYDGSTKVVRKIDMPKPAGASGATPGASAQPTGVDTSSQAPFVFDHMEVSSKLFHSVAVGALRDGISGDGQFASGTAIVQKGTFTRLNVAAVDSLQSISTGDNAFNVFFVPGGKRMVQMVGMLPGHPDDPYAWAKRIGEFAVLDSADNSTAASGAFAKVQVGTEVKMVGSYDSGGSPLAIDIPSGNTRPTDVWLLFLVPDGATMKELDFAGHRLASINQKV